MSNPSAAWKGDPLITKLVETRSLWYYHVWSCQNQNVGPRKFRETAPGQAEMARLVIFSQVFSPPLLAPVCMQTDRNQIAYSFYGRPSYCRPHCTNYYQSPALYVGGTCTLSYPPVVPAQKSLQRATCVSRSTLDFTQGDAVAEVKCK